MEEKENLKESIITIDPLTKLYTRYFIYHNFPKILEEAKNFEKKIAVVMLDIDNFKSVNDTYGHLKGDEVLKKVAEVLKRSVREKDILVRYAGDEFLVILNDVDERISKNVAQRIIKEISKISIEKIKITVSAGLAIYPQDGQTLQDLLDKADKALYLSKEKGKNRLSLAQEVIQEAISIQEALKLFPTKRFINRTQQLEFLKKRLSDTLGEKMSLVIIKGKVGIGKTRLLNEFERYAKDLQIISLKNIAQERKMLQPYYTLSQGLEEFLQNNEVFLSALTASLPPKEVQALAKLLPSFKKLIKESLQEETEETRLNIFKGFRDIFVQFSQFQGLLLCFDDVQWLDEATLRLLSYFIDNEFIRKIMVCCTLSEEELKEHAPFKKFLKSPKKNINFDIIELPPFGLEETKEMICSIFPQITASEEFYNSIFEITGGNPLFIEEMLKYLIESGVIFYKDKRWQIHKISKEEIPSSLEEVLKRRFRKLDPETKEFLAQAVVIGKDFQLDFLRHMVKKDLGFLFELIDRAKRRGFIEAKKLNTFDFLNPFLQKVIYEELSPSEKISLHKKITQAIEEVYKKEPPPQDFLQELTYHYEKIGDTSKLHKYKTQIEKEISKIFDPTEITSYLEEMTTEISTEETPAEVKIRKIEKKIKEEDFEKIAEFLRWVSAALRNIILYPEGNQIREYSIKRAHSGLIDIFNINKEISSLTFNEVEGILIVNGHRLPSHYEKAFFIQNFISTLIEKEIKGVQFLPELEEKELSAFLVLLSQKREDLKKKGGIGQILKEKGIKNIKVDTARYERVATQQRFQPLEENIMKFALLDILSGEKKQKSAETLITWLSKSPQILAQKLTEIARDFVLKKSGKVDFIEEAKVVSDFIQKVEKIVSERAPHFKESLVKMVSHLDSTLKSYLISQKSSPLQKEKEMLEKIVNNLSNEEIVEMIINASRAGKDSLLHMRELFEKFTSLKGRREEIASLLKKRLSKIGLSEGEISFVIQKDYSTLSLKEKVDTLLKLPPSGYSSLGIENIRELLNNLIKSSQKEALEKIIDKFLFYLKQSESSEKETVFTVLNNFLESTPLEETQIDPYIAKIISSLKDEILNLESPFYEHTLKILDLVIKWCYKSAVTSLSKERYIIHLRFSYLNELVECIHKALNKESTNFKVERNKEKLRLFVFKLLDSDLVETLIFELADPSLEHTEIIENILVKLGEPALKKIISVIVSKTDFTFEGYIYRKKISYVLKKMGKKAAQELKRALLSEKEIPKLIRLIEIVGFLQDKDFVDVLAEFSKHPDYEVKKTVISALAEIGGSEAEKILSEMSRSSDVRISRLAAEKIKK